MFVYGWISTQAANHFANIFPAKGNEISCVTGTITITSMNVATGIDNVRVMLFNEYKIISNVGYNAIPATIKRLKTCF